MRKAKISVKILMIAVICCCVFVAVPFVSVFGTEGEETLAAGNWKSFALDLEGGYQLAVENESLEIYVDGGLNIAVRDKHTDKWHYSCPPELEEDNLAGKNKKESIRSIVHLTYLDAQSQTKTMISLNDCVLQENSDEKQYQLFVDTQGKKLRIELLFGKREQRTLLANAFPSERFEWLLTNGTADDAKVLNRFYKLWSINDTSVPDVRMKDRVNTYPIMNEMDVYAKQETQAKENRQIEAALRSAGYTLEMKDEDAEILGISEITASSPFFYIPVEFSLEGDQFVASVKTGEIEHNYQLLDVMLMPFFNAGKTGNDGYIFVPDGSGALINFNNEKNKTNTIYSKKVYGVDFSSNDLTMQDFLYNIAAPVYGIKDGDQSTFSIIEQGDANATLYVELGNMDSLYNAVYSRFSYAFSDTFYFDDSGSKNDGWKITDKNVHTADFTTRYFFLEGEQNGYVGMANCYRKYLQSKDLMPDKLTLADPTLYIDLLGSCDGTKYFLVFPYNAKMPLTTFSDAVDMIKSLKENNANMVVRYLGWANGGLFNTVSNTVKVQKELGGKKEFNKLVDYLEETGIPFYADVDPMALYDTRGWFNGFNTSKNSPRKLDNQMSGIREFSMARNLPRGYGFVYLIKPSQFENVFNKFAKKYDALGVPNLSMSRVGKQLYGDYRAGTGSNIDQSKDFVANLLKTASEKYSLMIEYGNAYAVPYADRVVNFPLTSTGLFIEDDTVPFMQIVYHGRLEYAGNALNIGQDVDDYFLRTIETGANIRFTTAKQNLDKLKTSEFYKYPSVGFDAWEGRINEYTRIHREALSGLQNMEITNHEILQGTSSGASGVNRVTYENGTRIYVNYTRYDYQSEDGVIPARSHKVFAK